jgi:hypothetical protein
MYRRGPAFGSEETAIDGIGIVWIEYHAKSILNIQIRARRWKCLKVAGGHFVPKMEVGCTAPAEPLNRFVPA